jgi:segregation and condensation protein B
MESSVIQLDRKIEALLFMKGEPMGIAELMKLCSVGEGELEMAIAELITRLEAGATRLTRTEDTVALTTKPELYEFLQEVLKLERTEPLTKSQLEVLSIVLYEHPVSAAKVEYVRGVNSRYRIRALMLRGLIERKADENDARVSLYVPTIELLQLLGITDVTRLPDYALIKDKLAAVVQDKH